MNCQSLSIFLKLPRSKSSLCYGFFFWILTMNRSVFGFTLTFPKSFICSGNITSHHSYLTCLSSKMHCSPANIYFLPSNDSFLQDVAGWCASRCSGNPIHQGRARRVGLRCLTLPRHLHDSSGFTADTRVTGNISWH